MVTESKYRNWLEHMEMLFEVMTFSFDETEVIKTPSLQKIIVNAHAEVLLSYL